MMQMLEEIKWQYSLKYNYNKSFLAKSKINFDKRNAILNEGIIIIKPN